MPTSLTEEMVNLTEFKLITNQEVFDEVLNGWREFEALVTDKVNKTRAMIVGQRIREEEGLVKKGT